jgi:hypothetical protein
MINSSFEMQKSQNRGYHRNDQLNSQPNAFLETEIMDNSLARLMALNLIDPR